MIINQAVVDLLRSVTLAEIWKSPTWAMNACHAGAIELEAAADKIRKHELTIATQARTIAALRERLGEDHA